MDYIIVKCDECGKWNDIVMEVKYRHATQQEKEHFAEAAGPKRVLE